LEKTVLASDGAEGCFEALGAEIEKLQGPRAMLMQRLYSYLVRRLREYSRAALEIATLDQVAGRAVTDCQTKRTLLEPER